MSTEITVSPSESTDELFMVVSESGNEYLVDARDDVCECPDHQYREAHCKHLRRVEYVTGERAIPAWVDPTAVDAQLGSHVETSPVLAATDGGVTVETSEHTKAHDEGRPEDCDCGEWCPDDLPCWPCFREGSTRLIPKSARNSPALFSTQPIRSRAFHLSSTGA